MCRKPDGMAPAGSSRRVADSGRISHVRRNALAPFLFAGILLGASHASRPADLGEANIRTPFRADGRFCYLYLAAAKGYFTREGLKLRIDEGENSVQVLQTVGAGQDFMTYPSLNLLPL